MARTLSSEQTRLLHDGTVIPAHPLALDANRGLDEQRQRALTRYYVAAGAGGVAVGVHTTQFQIREVGLLVGDGERGACRCEDVRRVCGRRVVRR